MEELKNEGYHENERQNVRKRKIMKLWRKADNIKEERKKEIMKKKEMVRGKHNGIVEKCVSYIM